RAAPDQDAYYSGGEEEGAQDDVPRGVHGADGTPSERFAECSEGVPSPPLRPARTIAPTAASSSRMEEASKGSRNRSRSRCPIAAGSPKPGPTSGPWVSSASRAEERTATESSTKSAIPSSGASRRWPGIGSQADSPPPPT